MKLLFVLTWLIICVQSQDQNFGINYEKFSSFDINVVPGTYAEMEDLLLNTTDCELISDGLHARPHRISIICPSKDLSFLNSVLSSNNILNQDEKPNSGRSFNGIQDFSTLHDKYRGHFLFK